MLLKTHLAAVVFMILLFINHISHKFIFAGMVLFATLLPDADSGFSLFGKSLILKPIQFFAKHRGVIHSFTVAILVSVLLAIFLPIASFGFFIGYSTHLIFDSFTKDGIQPFWPMKLKSRGIVLTGGKFEQSLFFFLVFIDIALFLFVSNF